jgi:hypothetical protein
MTGRPAAGAANGHLWWVLAPIVLAGLGAGMIAPDMNDRTIAGFNQMFGTCAQVVAALLVVIAVEVSLTTFRGLDLPKAAVKTGLASGCMSLVAAVAALSPSLSDQLYDVCFVVALAGGAGSLVTVILVGLRAIDQAWEGAKLADVWRDAMLGDPAAKKELLELGEPKA